MKAQSSNAQLSRRDFLATTASAAALTVVAGCANHEERRSVAKGDKIPVGLQIYSVRKDAEKDLPGVLAKVAQMGYQGVEFAGYYGHGAKDIRKMLDDNGLVCCGTHTQMTDLADDKLAATIEFNKTLGNPYLIVPWLAPAKTDPKETWLGYARRFNVLAEKVQPHGMQVGYHNHAHDFAPLDGTTPWDILASNTRSDVILQLDTGNALDGGGDPILYLKRYPGRSVTIHLKEFSATNKQAMIGEGDVPWAEVFTLCRTIGGTKWYIIEEEKDAVPPLQGAQISLNNLRKLRT